MRIAERNPNIWRHSCMEYSEAEGDVQATGVKLLRCVIEDVGSIDMLQQFCLLPLLFQFWKFSICCCILNGADPSGRAV